MAKLIPVIHWTTDQIAIENAAIADAAGCAGVFLIDMTGERLTIDKSAQAIKKSFPRLKVGANRLGMRPVDALEYDRRLGLDATWTDMSGVSSRGLGVTAIEAKSWMEEDRRNRGKHLYFAGVAFKYQSAEPMPSSAAAHAAAAGFVPTTSGEATGQAPDIEKIRLMKRVIGSSPLAIASGISPENAKSFLPYCSYMLVATGISRDFAHLDSSRVRALQEACTPSRQNGRAR